MIFRFFRLFCLGKSVQAFVESSGESCTPVILVLLNAVAAKANVQVYLIKI